MKKLLYVYLILLLSVFAVNAQKKEDCLVKVTFLHVNDVYSFMPVDGGERGGLGRVLTLKKKFVAENPNTIFTMGGDTLSPSVESRTYKGQQMIDAWNAVGLDYAVLGNHEFDVKTDVLLQRMKESKFQWLGANVVDKKTNKIFADTPPFVIREIGGVKVGIIGFLLPETKQTSSMEENLEVTDFCQTAKKYVKQMRKQGAKTVVGLTHLAMSQDKQLAKCADFDLILGGHEHSLLQSSSNDTPIFKMTADARELGKFDLFINKTTGKLEQMDWEIVPVTNKIEDAPEFASVVDKYKDLLQKLAEPIGRTSEILDALSFSNRNKETNVGNFIADSYRNATGADIGFVNGGSIRADLIYNVGTLTKRDVLSILPFNNPIVKVEISGKILRQILEHGVARSAEESEAGRFPQVSGLKFTFDITKPAGNRVTEIIVENEPLNDSKNYTLATSDFIVSRGGDGYTMFKDAKVLIKAEDAQKDSEVFEKAIRQSPNATISPKLENRITRIGQKSGETKADCK
jgi:5'-nucleotidase